MAGLLKSLLQVALDELSMLPTHFLFLLFLCDTIQIVQVGLGQSRDACADFLLDLTECVGRIDLRLFADFQRHLCVLLTGELHLRRRQ